MSFAGCQRHRPLREMRSRVSVFSRCAFSRSHTALTPDGSGTSVGDSPAPSDETPRQTTALTDDPRFVPINKSSVGRPDTRSMVREVFPVIAASFPGRECVVQQSKGWPARGMLLMVEG